MVLSVKRALASVSVLAFFVFLLMVYSFIAYTLSSVLFTPLRYY